MTRIAPAALALLLMAAGRSAAEAAGVGRVVYFSSGQVFGVAEGERLPDYFPVDDAHPRRAMRPYGLSKCLAETASAGRRAS